MASSPLPAVPTTSSSSNCLRALDAPAHDVESSTMRSLKARERTGIAGRRVHVLRHRRLGIIDRGQGDFEARELAGLVLTPILPPSA